MPDFWTLPTASMGLSTPSAIYQARFAKYLEHRLKPANGGKVWCFLGDGKGRARGAGHHQHGQPGEGLDNLNLGDQPYPGAQMARCAATGKSFKSSNEASVAPIGTSSR